MPDRPQSTRSLDFQPATESLRRTLYDAVIRILWTPSISEDDRPRFSPEQARLTVLWAFGRWFAVWYDVDTDEAEPHLPMSQRWQVVRIQDDPARPDGIGLHEV
jgi:hypothetical protein